MYFRRFYDEQLAQASYLIGCQANGTAIVIDPARVIAPYLEVAAAESLRIVAVTETHIHADFLSGLRELSAATGARAYLSGCGTPAWQYGFRTDPNITVLVDRGRITIGNVTLEAVHTPGHTPEHLVFVVTDGATATEPIGIVTGDFVFVGDVGRPDLLEKAARIADTAAAGARQLFRSLTWFKTLPDHWQIWPGHGAGSACGKGLGAMPQSTVGYERRFNWAFGPAGEEEFVRLVLAGQPEPPPYFARMKQVNRDGPPILGALPTPRRVTAADLGIVLGAGGLVVDGRPTPDYAAGHLPGTINIPFTRSFVTHAGSLLPYDQDLHVILPVQSDREVAGLVASLVSIGLDRIAGVAGPDAVPGWVATGGSLATLARRSAAEVRHAPSRGIILDVRNRSEWELGHIPGATLIPLPELVERLGELSPSVPVLVHCAGGTRSGIAASLLETRGFTQVTDLKGGFTGWVADGGPVDP